MGPGKALEPKLQVWVTGIALVVGFLCGLMVSYNGFFRPSLEIIQQSTNRLDQSIQTLGQFRDQEADDHRFIRLAARHPEVFDEIVKQFEPLQQDHFREIAKDQQRVSP